MAHLPNQIILRDSGIENMGDVTNKSSAARFSLPGEFHLRYLRATFAEAISGNGATGNADMQLKVDNEDDSELYDFILAEWQSRGLGSDAIAFVNWRLRDDELAAWRFRTPLVVEWTNPEATGKMRWSLEFGLSLEP